MKTKSLALMVLLVASLLLPFQVQQVYAYEEASQFPSDNFNDNTLSAYWNRYVTGASVEPAETGGAVVTYPVSNEASGLFSAVLYDCTELDIKIDVTANSGSALFGITDTLTNGTGHFSEGEWYHIGKFSDTNYAVQSRIDGSVTYNVALGSATGQTGSLRIVVSGGNISFYEEGTLRYSGVYGLGSYGMMVFFYGEGASVTFDNFVNGETYKETIYWDGNGQQTLCEDFNIASLNATRWVWDKSASGIYDYSFFRDNHFRLTLGTDNSYNLLRSASPHNMTNITMQVDMMFLSDYPNDYGGLFFGNTTIWAPNTVYWEFSNGFGAKVLLRNGAGSTSWLGVDYTVPKCVQLRVTFEGKSKATFYINNVNLTSWDCTNFFDTWNDTFTIGFHIEGIGLTGVSIGMFDNFYCYYGPYEEQLIYSYTWESTHLEYLENYAFPLPQVFRSYQNLTFTYPSYQTITPYVYVKDGFVLTDIIINDVAYNVDIVGENQYPILADSDKAIEYILWLDVGYVTVEVQITGLGITTSPGEGVYGVLDDSLFNMTATPFLIDPPGEYADFLGYTHLYGESEDFDGNPVASFTISENSTIQASCGLPLVAGTWFYRGIEINMDTPPAPYQLATDTTEIILTKALQNLNGTQNFNYVDMRISWHFSHTTYLPELVFNPPYLATGEANPSYNPDIQANPTLEQVANFISTAHDLGFNVYICLNPEWNMAYISQGVNWNSLASVRTFVTNYRALVLQVASFCETNDVEAFGIGLEMGEGVNLADYANYYLYTGCNTHWSETIRQTRLVYSGLLTQQLNTGYRQTDFNVLYQATYLRNLDYLMFDNFFVLQTNSSIYTANTVSRAYFNSYSGTNIFALYQEASTVFGKKIVINQAYTNGFNMMLQPWADTGEFRDDETQLAAWLGTMRAYRGQEWCGGIDFERYNQMYHEDGVTRSYTLGLYEATYFSSSWALSNATQQAMAAELQGYGLTYSPPTPLAPSPPGSGLTVQPLPPAMWLMMGILGAAIAGIYISVQVKKYS